MPFKNIIARTVLLTTTLCGLSSVAVAQVDTFIFRYVLSPDGFSSPAPSAGLTLKYSDGTTETANSPGLTTVVSREKKIIGKMLKEVDVLVGYVSANRGCKTFYSSTLYMGGPYGYEARGIWPVSRSGSVCDDTPTESTVTADMSLLPVIHIENVDRVFNPADNIYCDNQSVHLRVSYFAHQLAGAYWQYRVDNGAYYPLKYNAINGVWDATNNIQGNDISFTLRDIFGANYTQYLNRRIEFRAVHAQQFDIGYTDGDGVQRHVDRPNEGSNSFTYIFYPSTPQPVNVKAIDPPCSDGNTFGVDIQFDRQLVPGEVINSLTINTAAGVPVGQYPHDGDPPLTLDASNTLHITGAMAPGDYYLTVEGYYLSPANPECNKNFYNFTIHAPTPVTFTVDSKKDVACFGEATGAITLKGDGGAGGYAYSIDNGANWLSASNTIGGLAKGSYTVIARDANLCPATASQTVDINQPATALTTSVTGYSDPTGATRNDGSINIAVSGGSPQYSYLWSNGATTQNISGLGGGTYTVTVTDTHGCSAAIDTIALVSPPPITIGFKAVPVSCYGLSDGGIQATVSGGQKPYTYAWSNGSHAANLSNVPAGHYLLTVTDANNVPFTDEYDLGQPAALKIAATVTPVSCNGKTDGAIATVVSGGTTPYTYRWSNGATMPGISQLAAGNYHLAVTDAGSCPAAMDTSVPQPAALSISGTVTRPTRFGSTDAKIDVTVSGGTTPYAYSWSNGATTEDVNALGDGNYTVTITDKNRCTITKDFLVNQPGPLLVDISRDAVVGCYGSSTGELTAHVSGGVLPYTYQWSNGGATASLKQLPAGAYRVTITDANGITVTDTASLANPPVLNLTVTGSEISCDGGQTGTATSAASGGIPPYSYRWNTGATTPNLSGLAPGLYTLHITDANNCTLSGNATVTGASALAVTAFTQPPTCNGDNDGFIELQPSGGHTPYTYSWSNGATTKDISNLPAGAYTIRLTDSRGCGITGSYTLPEPLALTLDLGADRTLCAGQSLALDGSIPGGVLYSWSGPNGFTASTPAVNISEAGRYTLVAVNGKSCQATDDLLLTHDAREITANFLVSTEAYTGDTVVAVNITGQGADHADWQLPAAAKIISQSDNLVELRFDQAGNYGLTLNTHLGNCQTSASRNIMILASTQLPGGNTPHTSLFVRTVLRPNPSSGQFYLDITPTADANVNYRFLDVQRNRVVFEQKGQLTKDVLNTQAFNIPNLTAGVYVLLVESSLETKALKVLIL